ncbi:MAG: ATP-binding protein [Metallosphaera yellowstonensis]|jgi:predicted AAA+ superfamily ATPase
MSLISQMNFQNPWWADKGKIYEDEHIRKVLSSKPRFLIRYPEGNLLVLGPRQVGKTSLMKTAIMRLLESGVEPAKILFFSCDSLKDKGDLVSLLSDYRSLVNSEGGFIFLDEITFVREWNVGLLHLFNSGYLRDSTIYVSGSSSVSLMKETLPGRPLSKVVLYPLNFRVIFNVFFRELNLPKVPLSDIKGFYNTSTKLLPHLPQLNRALMEYVKRGGFFTTNYVDGDPLNVLYEVYKDAVLSDLARLGRNERTFKEIMAKIVESYGSRISENTIAKRTSVGSHNTVSSYLDLAEKLFVLRTFWKVENGRVNTRSFKKVYFVDPFIYRVMKRYSTGEGISEEDVPHVVEGIVGEHLAREYSTGYTFFKGGREVDFVIDDVGVEVKLGGGEFRDLRMDKGYVLTLDEMRIEGNKAIMPISMFLYMISSNRVLYPWS